MAQPTVGRATHEHNSSQPVGRDPLEGLASPSQTSPKTFGKHRYYINDL